MERIRRIIFVVLKNAGVFLEGGILGILSLLIFAKPIFEASIRKDIGLGIVAIAPIVSLIYIIIFGLVGGILGVIIYNFVNFF